MAQPLRVLFVVSEAVPYAKTGGLADVAGTLPYALRDLGADVRVLMPYYGQIKQKNLPVTCVAENLEGTVGPLRLRFNLLTPAEDGAPFYFVERDEFFERSQLYGTPQGDYFDNLERFAFFCSTVLPVCRALDFAPDLIHCHDWQAALVPVYLRYRWAGEAPLARAKSLLTIHNLAYQGLFPKEKFPLTGLNWSLFSINGLEYYDKINLLKGGIVFADAVSTVSPNYSQEIQTPEYGYGLDGVLRTRAEALFGILNGVDYRDWDPATDPLIPAHYHPGDLKGKAKNKRALMAAFGLDKKLAKQPLLGIISRLADQKGFDLLAAVLPELMFRDIPLVILGTGEEKYHRWLEEAAPKYAGRLGVKIAFDNRLAHLIEAGADIFLMPSRYEPCGLNQMYSMKYGTVPVVRATGGLVDTVTPVDTAKGTGTGFLFEEYSAEAFIKAINQAVEAYQNKKLWRKIMLNGMKEDFSWQVSAKKYLELYQRLVSGPV
ncbi:MAG: glycogen synthase GlgA [Deltaproteobacteria bacterium]|nr:glycogen synthase GlgA [Deltaproteobacteria bacterium]